MDDTSERPFGLWMTTALVVGSMIGAGIFAFPSVLAPIAGTGAVAWFVAVGGALLIGRVLTRLAATDPAASGLVEISGKALGPLAGVLLGWSYWVSILTANPTIAVVACRYLSVFRPAIADTPMHNALAASGLIWLLTLLNLAGARASGWFNAVATVVKVLPLVAVVAILAGLLVTGHPAFDTTPHAPFRVAEITPALAIVFTALFGFETAGMISERVRDPARTVPRATMIGILATGTLYLIVCSGIVYAMPQDAIAGSAAPIALFVETFWGRWAGLAIAAFGAVAAIGCLNAWVLMQGEVPLGMARAGLLPRWFGRTSAARDVPVGVLLLSSALSTVLAVSSAMGSAASLLDVMLRITAVAGMPIYVGGCAAALVLRVSRGGALLGLLFALWAMWGAGPGPIAWGLVLVLTALPLYWLRPRTGATPQRGAIRSADLGSP